MTVYACWGVDVTNELDVLGQLSEIGIGSLVAIALILFIWNQWQTHKDEAKIRLAIEQNEAQERSQWMLMFREMLREVLESQFTKFQELQGGYINSLNDAFGKLVDGMGDMFEKRFTDAQNTMSGVSRNREQTLQLLTEAMNGIPATVGGSMDTKFNDIESQLRAMIEDIFNRFGNLEQKLCREHSDLKGELLSLKEPIEAIRMLVEKGTVDAKQALVPDNDDNNQNGDDHD
jgi:hypothetical protein